MTILMCMGIYGHKEILEKLLEKGMDIRRTDARGLDVFMFASAYGQLEIVKFLIEKGAEINRVDNKGFKSIDER